MTICPICNQAKLLHDEGSSKLGGILTKPDQWICAIGRSQAEIIQEDIRYIYVSGPYAELIGDGIFTITSFF